MLKMNKLTTSIAIALGLAAGTANATNGDQLLGVTAIHWGMGGAVVAAPQDAATIFTNPAGLSELDIETVRFDLSPGFLNPPRSVNNVDSDSDLFFLPSGAIAYRVNDRMTLGLGLGAQSGMGVDVSDVAAAAGTQPMVTTKGLFRIAPSIAIKVNNDLSVGASLNIGYQSLALYNAAYQFPQNQQFGFGASLGAVYHVNDQVQVGASWTSEMDVNEHEFNTVGNGKFKMDMDAPQTLALGVAYKPGNGLLIEADLKWIEFSATNKSVAIVHPDPSSPVAGIPTAANFGWDDQVVLALGIQKELNPTTTVRMGLNYGESPIEANDVNTNLGSVAIPEKHLSLGMTRKLGKNLSGSLSYTHAFENEITSDTTSNTFEIKQNIFYAQVSYAF